MPTFRVRCESPALPDRLIACDDVVVAPLQVLCHQFVARDEAGLASEFLALLPREGVWWRQRPLGVGQPEGTAQG